MPGPFTILTSSSLVTIDDSRRQANIAFTVTNTLSRRLRATAHIKVPDGSPAGDWVKILQPGGQNDAPELPGTSRPYDLGATENYQVKIDVPAGAPAGSYSFRLVVADESDPDDRFTESADVAVVVKSIDRPPFPYWIIPVIIAVLLVGGGVTYVATRPQATSTPTPTNTATATAPPTLTPTLIPPTATATRTPTRTATATRVPMSLSPSEPYLSEFFVGNDYFLDPPPVLAYAASNDEFTASEQAGGVDSQGRECTGMITQPPLFRAYIEDDQGGDITFYFVSLDTKDYTMLVYDPFGNIHCNDAAGINTGLTFTLNEVTGEGIGEYYIWLGINEPPDEFMTVEGNFYITLGCIPAVSC